MLKFSLGFIAFLQATGIAVYCFLIGLVFIYGNSWFGPKPNFLGPALFLLLFIFSAVLCTLIFLAYPFHLLWIKKQPRTAVRLVIYSTLWLAGYLFPTFILLALA